ncbi:MAG TPA: cytochrome c biogenesis protein CcsA [Cyclobacteriaceae bacterium]|nr:cytochrome c biogenesis protein CcsA [Cyclobacteriaceae bacterium]
MRSSWWKILSALLLVYTVIGGLLFWVPALEIVNETIRNLYFHVPMWFTMILLFGTSTWFSIRYLRAPNTTYDIYSVQLANTGFIFGILGVVTGMLWAQYAWGTWWHGDPKQNGSAITLLIYSAYFVLRASVENEDQRNRLSAIYNIFAFIVMIPLLFIIPRMQDSLHPGSGGNPGFNMYDLDSSMRKVFYPACAGWILLGFWIASVRIRVKLIEEKYFG